MGEIHHKAPNTFGNQLLSLSKHVLILYLTIKKLKDGCKEPSRNRENGKLS